ncbi:selenocysteine-specific translation elongation factor [Anoxynatronum sibiricum]|uniref:Selenocysteine-specific elongation factor n=1 Tax=Anoxynatronum sibiricum TaxID=210623 RepID=A0ABU9VPY0_9CLOT
MKHLIIGTAGHIDHGKTTLIHALTGRNTDRLKEEQKRGISIELGFTYFDLPDERRAGIIDVPGHEKFIRHMLAGVGGMDLVMLVVAADEGVMPQTKEHLDILSLLDMKQGVIVITKSSLVETDWLELIKEEIRQATSDTFLESSPIIAVDSITGEGIPALLELLTEAYDRIETRDQTAPCRIPIDRVFTITGFGTVVTGTLLEGTAKVEETLEIFPEETAARIRNIQVHGNTVKEAYAGQRVAINLSGLKKDQIKRGSFLAQPGSMTDTMMVDCRIKMLKNASRPLKQRDRIRLYHGTSEILARVVILEKEQAEPGESALVQFRLEERAAFRKEDKLIVRFYSPMQTLGGALVIDPNPEKHKALRQDVIDELQAKESGGPEVYLEQQILRFSKELPDTGALCKHTGYSSDQLITFLQQLEDEGSIYSIGSMAYVHQDYYHQIVEDIVNKLSRYHKDNPLRRGMPKEELKSRVFGDIRSKTVDRWLEQLEIEEIIKADGKLVALAEFKIKINPIQQNIMNQIESLYLEKPFAPPRLEEIAGIIKVNEKEVRQVIELMLGQPLIRINQEMVFHQNSINTAKDIILKHFENHSDISPADFRDLLNTSRKFAVALLEYFDQEKLTKRNGDSRILSRKS